MSGDIATILRNDWAEQGTPHSPFMSLNASTVMAVTEMGPVRRPRHREGNRLCPVTQRQAGCAGTRHQPVPDSLASRASALLHRGRAQSHHQRRGGCPGGADGASLGT